MKHWLMKAEPDVRIVKGKDVKFSVDDFEECGTTAWEGVRNHEAKNLMKEMQIGDKVLFYHSNCKTPGIAGFAEVSKLAYPDHSAWDPKHPYYDPKTDKDAPKWYMVDLKFVRRAPHFVPLALLRHIAASPEAPAGCAYIGAAGVQAVKGMALVNRGRLSVQRVEESAYATIQEMADKGGWEDGEFGGKKPAKEKGKGKAQKRATKKKPEAGEEGSASESEVEAPGRARKRKRGADDGDEGGEAAETQGVRRSARRKV